MPDAELAETPPDCLEAGLTWLLEQSRFKAAQALYARAHRLQMAVAVPKGYAQRLAALGRAPEAVALLTQWAEYRDKTAADWAKQVLALQTMRFDDAAQALCRQARARFPKNDALALSEVVVSFRLGDPGPARDLLAALSARRDAPYWIHAMLRALQSGEIDAMGLSLRVPPDLVSPRILISLARGLYEVHERNSLLADLRPGDRVLELGTGLGAMACWAGQTQRDVPFVTIEANPALAPLIAENFRRNACKARAISGVAALRDGESAFHIEGDFWASSQVTTSDTATRRTLPNVNIPALMQDFAPTIMVVDIEGAEVDLIPELPLQSLRRLIIEMHPQFTPLTGCAKVWRRLLEAGFYPQQAKGSEKVVIWDRIQTSETGPET